MLASHSGQRYQPCVLSEKGLYKKYHLLSSHLAYVIITVVVSLSHYCLPISEFWLHQQSALVRAPIILAGQYIQQIKWCGSRSLAGAKVVQGMKKDFVAAGILCEPGGL